MDMEADSGWGFSVVDVPFSVVLLEGATVVLVELVVVDDEVDVVVGVVVEVVVEVLSSPSADALMAKITSNSIDIFFQYISINTYDR